MALAFGPAAVPLSVLDLAPVPDGGNPGDALRATIDLARRAEGLGFRRFWVDLLEATAADELMITTMVFDPADRLRSFELVAALAGVSPPGPVGRAPQARPASDHR
jgi:hypothetical protein